MRAEVSRLASLLTEQAGTFKRETQCLRDESHALRLCRDEHEAQLRGLRKKLVEAQEGPSAADEQVRKALTQAEAASREAARASSSWLDAVMTQEASPTLPMRQATLADQGPRGK